MFLFQTDLPKNDQTFYVLKFAFKGASFIKQISSYELRSSDVK